MVLAIGGSAYALGTGEAKTTATPSAAAAGAKGVERKVKIGVFRGTSPWEVDQFGDWLGRDVHYAVDYSTRTTWKEIADPEWMLSTWEGSPYRMVYGVAMLPIGKGDKSTIAKGAKGKYNKHYRELAKNLVKHGQGDAILRLGWEFNHPSYRWHPTNQKQFVTYWRKIVKTMRSVPGASGLQFDWNVNNGNQSKPNFDPTKYYPGNKWVDYIGVDIYDISWPHYPYPKNCGKACRLKQQKKAWKLVTGQQYGLNFWADFARRKGRPMALPEWGVWKRKDGHGGADNPYYVTQMHKFINNPKNKVAYHAYFEFSAPSGDHRLSAMKNSGKRFKKLFG